MWRSKHRVAWRVVMGCLFTIQVSALSRSFESTCCFVLDVMECLAVQAVLGYFLMLIAMTYQVELFLAVVLGLGVGHTLFNVQEPVSESVDACCVDSVSHNSYFMRLFVASNSTRNRRSLPGVLLRLRPHTKSLLWLREGSDLGLLSYNCEVCFEPSSND